LRVQQFVQKLGAIVTQACKNAMQRSAWMRVRGKMALSLSSDPPIRDFVFL